MQGGWKEEGSSLSRKSAWSPIKHCETRLEAVLTFSFQPRARSPPREALPAKLPPPVLPGDCSGVLLLWPRLRLHSWRNALLNTRTRLVRIWGTPRYWRRWVLLVTVWRWLPAPESSSETSRRHPGNRLWCARLSCGNKWRPNPKSLIQCKFFSLFMLPVLWGLQGGLFWWSHLRTEANRSFTSRQAPIIQGATPDERPLVLTASTQMRHVAPLTKQVTWPHWLPRGWEGTPTGCPEGSSSAPFGECHREY